MITEIDMEYLTFIKTFINIHGYPPSIREIAKSLYVSNTTAHRHLMKLVDNDLIRYTPKISRGYSLKGSA